MKTSNAVIVLALMALAAVAVQAPPADAGAGMRQGMRPAAPPVPPGTRVILVFDQAVSSSTAKVGQPLKFHVADNVMVGNKVVIRKGTPVTGTIASVEKREHYGISAKMRISLNPVRTVSGQMVPLQPRTEGARVGQKTGEAGAATAGGAAILGPVGLVGGYFVEGKTVNIKPGDKLDTEVVPEDPEPPAGTRVVLVFDQPVSSKTAKVGQTIKFHVLNDVMVGNRVVIKKGTPVTGVISSTEKKEHYGISAKMRIALNPVRTVSGRMAPLEPSVEGERVGKKTGEAGLATAGGAAILGPVGLVGGYFVEGKTVNIKPGDKLVTEIAPRALPPADGPGGRESRRGRT